MEITRVDCMSVFKILTSMSVFKILTSHYSDTKNHINDPVKVV